MKTYFLHMLFASTLVGTFSYATKSLGLQLGADAVLVTFEKVPAAISETQDKNATAAADQSLNMLQEVFMKTKF